MKDQMDEYVYEIAKNKKLNDSTNEWIVKNSLFRIYHRGKSYTNSDYCGRMWDQVTPDEPFELRDQEYVLYCSTLKLTSYDLGTIIITINRHFDYIVYEFAREVNPEDEYTPDYYGWDGDDIGKSILVHKIPYDNIKNMNIRSNFSFDYDYLIDGDHDRKYQEKLSSMLNHIYKKILY
jgi:hypothetical protein